MYSPVFALNPKAAAGIVDAFIVDFIEFEEKEVFDINEESYRKGILDTTLYGYLKVPKIQDLFQGGKDSSGFGRTVEDNKSDITRFIIEFMEERSEQENTYIAFITGASRTADIERVLTIGVHGPREMEIIIVEDR